MIARDRDLLVLGVAVEADDLEAVEERPGDRLRDVGSREEQHVGQVQVDLEVVITECVVLRRVEHLQQRARRVAAPVRADLVDLVEQHDGVHRARLSERAHDPSRTGPDVGAAVTADLGLVVDATQRDAGELAPERAGHRLAE